MIQLRITKYNPKYRDNFGHYTREEWTCPSEIGGKFEGVLFTMDDYLKIESKYCKAAELMLNDSGLTSLNMRRIENEYMEELSSEALKNGFDDIKVPLMFEENESVAVKHIPKVCQLILRNIFWCKLEYKKEFYIHFGYDYYMYIGSKKASQSTINKIEQIGLFVEEYESPHYDGNLS